ncbi:hypothetical protein L1987_60417 [Smallanthus sonchifolius]|uniref:Uncharacterized protein n=1 Tax=Smallanthus sonchifolius TaxID=185202 RepID=A0ACB9D8E5_9ASTR|nr:hypothetical protein L1987_60417 [Smallanthus sonchifolius]
MTKEVDKVVDKQGEVLQAIMEVVDQRLRKQKVQEANEVQKTKKRRSEKKNTSLFNNKNKEVNPRQPWLGFLSHSEFNVNSDSSHIKFSL